MGQYAYVFAAFIIVWVALCAYILVLGQQQKRLKREIDQLKSTIQRETK